jgi:hypothetical protein
LRAVYVELEKVLNLLVPATQEAEMSEAAEQAAKNVAVKVRRGEERSERVVLEYDSI